MSDEQQGDARWAMGPGHFEVGGGVSLCGDCVGNVGNVGRVSVSAFDSPHWWQEKEIPLSSQAATPYYKHGHTSPPQQPLTSLQ